ncbi:MAG: DinB family protein [Acidobacteriia bacterium]|nr:DinB family protein [Terriglobia bacterium]
MKHLRTFCMVGALSFAASIFAQTPAATPAPPKAPPTIASIVEQQVGILEREFVGAAEAMPEDKYNFAPGSLNIQGSEFKGVRTFADQVKHVAATNYLLWGAITGDKSPIEIKDDNGPASLKTKAEIVKYLKDSFALGHKATKSLTAENAVAMVPSPFGPGQQVSKLFCATFSVAHGFDHYGQTVEYLRMNGIVPPASRGGN